MNFSNRFFALKNYWFLIGILILIGAFLRFYNLLWGAPYFFHPDERNIIYAISQLSFPSQMNPHFFAYGSLPIYFIYLASTLFSYIANKQNDFAFMIFWLRFFSALLSSLTILSLFFIGTKLWNKRIGLFSAFLAVISTGFIQYAHFGTFEIWTTFFALWLFYASLLLLRNSSVKHILFAGIVMGILVSIKISNLTLIVFPLLCSFLYFFKTKSIVIPKVFSSFLLYFFCIGSIYLITNPFAILDTKDFLGSMQYESSVALGSLPVFYTGSFFNTIPVIFQFTMVYPFLLNPLLTVLLIPAFLFLVIKGIKHKNLVLVLLTIYYLIIFVSQAFLFVKWARYMVPTLGFVYIIISVWLEYIPLQVKRFLYVTIALVSLAFTYSFIKTVYFSPDTRVVAAQWAQDHIANTTMLVTEPYDLGILPFNNMFPTITQLPMYEMDQNPQAFTTVEQNFSIAHVFVLPSQRLIHSRLINKTVFPLGATFYTNLLSNKTNYRKIYETPCDIFCTLTYIGNPLYHVEETANVFDRPTVMIFEKKL